MAPNTKWLSYPCSST